MNELLSELFFTFYLILVILIFSFSVFIKRHDYTRKENSCLHVRKTLVR